jgi:hypothetical protein
MQIIPLRAIPNQTLSVLVSNQNTRINVYQKGVVPRLYCDVILNEATPQATGILCQNLKPIVRYGYVGYQGDFFFFDTQGADDPVYTGLGSRFLLYYLAPNELPPGVN